MALFVAMRPCRTYYCYRIPNEKLVVGEKKAERGRQFLVFTFRQYYTFQNSMLFLSDSNLVKWDGRARRLTTITIGCFCTLDLCINFISRTFYILFVFIHFLVKMYSQLRLHLVKF